MNRLLYLKITALLSAVVLFAACFFPWIHIASLAITVTGVEPAGTNFGKPGYFHLIMVVIFIACTLVQRVGAKRLNLLVTALNLAWALRNFFVIPACSGGECPVKLIGLWLVLLTSVVMLLSAMIPDIKLPLNRDDKSTA